MRTDNHDAGCSCGAQGSADFIADHDCPLSEPSHAEEQAIPVVAAEPAVVRIARAIQALTRALPGVHMINVSSEANKRAISITANTDDDVRKLATLLGVQARDVLFESTHWVDASYFGDGIAIFVSGPQVPAVEAPALDETKVGTALAQASEALAL